MGHIATARWHTLWGFIQQGRGNPPSAWKRGPMQSQQRRKKAKGDSNSQVVEQGRQMVVAPPMLGKLPGCGA